MTSRDLVKVRTTEAGRLRELLAADGVVVTSEGADVLEVAGLDGAAVA